MKIRALLLFAVVITLAISSCNCAQDCTNHNYQFTFVFTGYSDSDVTPLVLKVYAKGSNFGNFIDSSIYPNLAATGAQVNGATQYSILLQDNDSSDYIISFPRIGQFDSITAMMFPLENCTACSKKYQINTLTTYSVNGKAVNNTDYGFLDIAK